MAYALIALYLVVTLAIGVVAYRGRDRTPEEYFLAGRGVGTAVLLFTLVATNFSAFFFLGVAEQGYKQGYGAFGILGFGTALIALSIYFIGGTVWKLGRRHGYITPPELIGDRLRSKALRLLFVLVMAQFTVPYLALQPLGAGKIVEQLTGIPEFTGAVILTAVIVLYVLLGGMRSVAWTDVMQGALMMGLLVVAVLAVADAFGGVTEANRRLFALKPELFGRAGKFTPKIWLSFMFLWMMTAPMLPQIFMRFFIARSARSLKTAARLYPLVALSLLFPIMIGVWAHLGIPDLPAAEADTVFVRMVAGFVPLWLAGLVMVGVLAALMSTMDSQLLALSSILTRDLWVGLYDAGASLDKQVKVGRAFVVLLALAGLVVAYGQPATIFDLATAAFTGFSILFPTTIAALYWRRTNAASCIVSILVGEAILTGLHYGWIPGSWTFGFLPVVPIIVTSSLIIVVGSLLAPRRPAAGEPA